MNNEVALLGKNETAVAAAAENSRALIESAYTVARNFPRDEDRARQKILDACRRPTFAESALYSKPVGSENVKGKWVKKYAIGLSIRAAEEAMRLWGNTRSNSQAIYEDEIKRIINITVIDLETNAMHSQDVTIMKHIEKKTLKDKDIVISERLNTNGEVVYTVVATAEEIDKKQGAAISKILRNHILRLLPAELKEEMAEVVNATKSGQIAENPAEARKKLLDAFHSIGIDVAAVGKLVDGQDLNTLSPDQISTLRMIYATIKAGEATYRDYIEEKEEEEAKITKAKKQPKRGEIAAGGDTLGGGK